MCNGAVTRFSTTHFVLFLKRYSPLQGSECLLEETM